MDLRVLQHYDLLIAWEMEFVINGETFSFDEFDTDIEARLSSRDPSVSPDFIGLTLSGIRRGTKTRYTWVFGEGYEFLWWDKIDFAARRVIEIRSLDGDIIDAPIIEEIEETRDS